MVRVSNWRTRRDIIAANPPGILEIRIGGSAREIAFLNNVSVGFPNDPLSRPKRNTIQDISKPLSSTVFFGYILITVYLILE